MGFISLVDEIQFMLISSRHICIVLYCIVKTLHVNLHQKLPSVTAPFLFLALAECMVYLKAIVHRHSYLFLFFFFFSLDWFNRLWTRLPHWSHHEHTNHEIWLPKCGSLRLMCLWNRSLFVFICWQHLSHVFDVFSGLCRWLRFLLLYVHTDSWQVFFQETGSC